MSPLQDFYDLRLSRLGSSIFSSTKKQSTTAGAISPVGMEMSLHPGNEDEEVESDAETVEDGRMGRMPLDMDTKSEMFTSPPLTPRTPMMMASSTTSW